MKVRIVLSGIGIGLVRLVVLEVNIIRNGFLLLCGIGLNLVG